MYINPFVAGVVSTILAEMLFVVVAAVIMYINDRRQ